MVTILISLLIQGLIAIIALTTLIIIYKLNQRIILNEIVRQERELKIRLFEYKEIIENKRQLKNRRIRFVFNHDTLLFDYYEYLALCINKKIINEKNTQLYFKTLIEKVKIEFESSMLFQKGYAKKEEYPGILWLFDKWNV
jgi:hypothetical protein